MVKLVSLIELDNQFIKQKEDINRLLVSEIEVLQSRNQKKMKKNKIIQELENKIDILQNREGKRFSEDFQMVIDILKRYGYVEYEINSFFDENIKRSKEFIIKLNTNM